MHVERLTKLADFLEVLPPEKFHIGSWANECPTVCCAWGWCPEIFPEVSWDACQAFKGSWLTYNGIQGMNAITEFFDIHMPTAHDIFMPTGYKEVHEVLPSHVVTKIRSLLCMPTA